MIKIHEISFVMMKRHKRIFSPASMGLQGVAGPGRSDHAATGGGLLPHPVPPHPRGGSRMALGDNGLRKGRGDCDVVLSRYVQMQRATSLRPCQLGYPIRSFVDAHCHLQRVSLVSDFQRVSIPFGTEPSFEHPSHAQVVDRFMCRTSRRGPPAQLPPLAEEIAGISVRRPV